MKSLRIIAGNDHRKSVFKAKRLGDLKMEAMGVEVLDAVIDGRGIPLRGFVQNGSEGRAGVFDVEIQLAGEECFVDEKRPAEIGLSNDRDSGFRFDVLRYEFGEDDLLGEKFGANGDFGLRRFGAGGKEADEAKEIKKEKESELGAAHVKSPSVCARGGRGGNRRAEKGARRGRGLRG